MAIQANAVSWVVVSREMIMAVQTNMPREDTTGTRGVLKGLAALGSLTLITQTPIHTNTNANRVPILVRSPVISPGNRVAKPPTNTNNIQFDLNGVLNFEWSWANAPG